MPAAGTARLQYHTSPLRWLWVLLHAAASMALVVTALGVRATRWLPRRRSAVLSDSSPIGDLAMSAAVDGDDAAGSGDETGETAGDEIWNESDRQSDSMVEAIDDLRPAEVPAEELVDAADATDPVGLDDPFGDGDLDLEAVFADDLDEPRDGEPT